MSKIYQITYTTENIYHDPVFDGIFEFLVVPCNNNNQEILSSNVANSENMPLFYSCNHLGFQTIRLRPHKAIANFKLEFSCEVVKAYEKQEAELPVEQQLAMLLSRDFKIDNYYWLYTTSFTSIQGSKKKPWPVYDMRSGMLGYLKELNSFLNGFIEYQKDQTNTDTTAMDVLHLRKGVCQDFNHLYLAIARDNGFACRYVSGYLNQGVNYLGSTMMHAWAEVFVPGPGWIGFDPTNNLIVDNQYIKVSHGRDYSDCPPIKGVILTNGLNETSHSVQVCDQ